MLTGYKIACDVTPAVFSAGVFQGRGRIFPIGGTLGFGP